MKKIKIAVIEDDILQQKFMETLVKATAKDLMLNIHCHYFECNG